MLTATARSVPGTLRQEILIDGHHVVVTDEPEHLGGEDAGPAPHELFPAALASCVSTTLAMYARTKGWELGSLSVDVDYDTRATPRRFTVVTHLDGDLTEEQLARLEAVAASCPVRRAIEAGITFEERLEHGSAPPAPLARGPRLTRRTAAHAYARPTASPASSGHRRSS